MTKFVNCPTCMKSVLWTTDNRYRPFCSERCKLIDLGDWAAGKHAIAGEPISNHDDEQPPPDSEDFLHY